MTPLADAAPDASPLVSADTLARDRTRRDLVVLDASTPLPGAAPDTGAAFRAARIPGARVFDLETFSDPDGAFPHTVPSAARFARLAGALGIGDGVGVVIYERGRMFAAARAWFLFRLFGHDDVRVLDGGLAAWRDGNHPLASGEPGETPAPRVFVPRFRGRLLAGLGDVLRPDTARVLLDARSADRFAGRVAEPRAGVRAGHIPGSRNLPYDSLLDKAGRMKDEASLRALFAGAGVRPGASVVTSCGTGVTAAVLALGLAVAGFGEAALYDGSWTEFASLGGGGDPAHGA